MAVTRALFVGFLLLGSFIVGSYSSKALVPVASLPSAFQRVPIQYATPRAIHMTQSQFNALSTTCRYGMSVVNRRSSPLPVNEMSKEALKVFNSAKTAITKHAPDALAVLEKSLGWLKTNSGPLAMKAKDQLISVATKHPVVAAVVVSGVVAYHVPWGPLVEWTWDRLGPVISAAPSTPITPGSGTLAQGNLVNNALTSYQPRFTGSLPPSPSSLHKPRNAVLDCANIAYRAGGNTKTFDGQAVVDVAKILQDKNFPVKAVLRKEMKGAIMHGEEYRTRVKNLDILKNWVEQNSDDVIWAWDDDGAILQTAANTDAFVISNDRYADWLDKIEEGVHNFEEGQVVKQVIQERVQEFILKGDKFQLVGEKIGQIYRAVRAVRSARSG